MNFETYIEKGINYTEYLKKVEFTLDQLKTSGENPAYENYYNLGLTRMQRLDKSLKLDFSSISFDNLSQKPKYFLIISEGWCGDAAQILPVVHQLAKHFEIEEKIVFRDQNKALIEAFQTNGGNSIPIIIGLNDKLELLFRYGPRPQYGMELLAKHKANSEVYTNEQFYHDLQLWYAKDKGQTILQDLIDLMQ